VGAYLGLDMALSPSDIRWHAMSSSSPPIDLLAADMVFLRCSDGVPASPGGCRWWAVAVVWRRWVGVVGGGGGG